MVSRCHAALPCKLLVAGGGYFAPLGAENPFAPNGQGKFVPNPLYGNPGWSDYDWQCCDDDGKYYPVPHAHGGSNGTMTNGFLSTSFGQWQTQQQTRRTLTPDTSVPPPPRPIPSGNGGSIWKAVIGSDLEKAINAGLPAPCLAALTALGITTTELLNAFAIADFQVDPNVNPRSASTDFSLSSSPQKITIRSNNEAKDFFGKPLGFLIHELSHGEARLNDSGIYNALIAKGISGVGTPVASTKAGPTDGDYSDVLSTFFNSVCP